MDDMMATFMARRRDMVVNVRDQKALVGDSQSEEVQGGMDRHISNGRDDGEQVVVLKPH
jgi:hypothetical protein